MILWSPHLYPSHSLLSALPDTRLLPGTALPGTAVLPASGTSAAELLERGGGGLVIWEDKDAIQTDTLILTEIPNTGRAELLDLAVKARQNRPLTKQISSPAEQIFSSGANLLLIYNLCTNLCEAWRDLDSLCITMGRRRISWRISGNAINNLGWTSQKCTFDFAWAAYTWQEKSMNAPAVYFKLSAF